MREEDLILARAIVAQQQHQQQNAVSDSPGASPSPLRKTLVTNLQERTKQFRNPSASSATSVSSSDVPLPPTDPQPSRPRCHPCRSCAKSFRFLYQLRNHEVVHSAERPWPCNCGKCFKSALALHMHRKRTGHHNWTVSCPRCGQCFAKTSDMKRHNASACAKFQTKKGV
ncbi:hypothetical protein pipiens_003608 [Culex pipiens pipiens]|uniref:C2H2-type domain-containing protein n=1 Tax=Culex pipiens pipiens TaxID=38569 RepID=A0ABD1CW29_CULPP